MIGAGFCNTGQILIARRLGEGRMEQTLSILSTGLRVAGVVGLCLVLFVTLACKPVSRVSSGMGRRAASLPNSWASGNGATCPPFS